MKTKKYFVSAFFVRISFAFIFFALCLASCIKEAEIGRKILPPDPNKESTVINFTPDSGGVATKMIIHGTNFGTDTSYIKVTINGKNARVIGSDGEALLVIVPSRADSGLVRVMIGKGADVKTLVPQEDRKFCYIFRENVTTICGQMDIQGIVDDSDGEVALLRRPWHVIMDKEGTLFMIDEGRGNNSDGGLRKYVNGKVTTIMRNSGAAFRSPTGLAFNLANDTLFMVQALWNDNSMVQSDPVIVAFARSDAFQVAKKYVNTGKYDQAFAIAIHPITDELFYGAKSDGFIYRVNRGVFPATAEKTINVIGGGTEMRFAFSPDGEYLYIINRNANNIYRAKYNLGQTEADKVFEPAVLFAGSGVAGHRDGVAIAAQFNQPCQGGCDKEGNLYVADKYNHCIRKISPDGTVTTFAGKPGVSGYSDGSPLESVFDRPECVHYSIYDDSWYVADRENQLIRRILVE